MTAREVHMAHASALTARWILVAAISLPIDIASFAVPTRAATGDAIDAYITAEMAKRRIPGLALAPRNSSSLRTTAYS
jgi:hypothetical protein